MSDQNDLWAPLPLEQVEIYEHSPRSFVYIQDNALPGELCDEIIRRFDNSPYQEYGRTGGGIQPKIKSCADLFLAGQPDWADIDQALHRCLGRSYQKLIEVVPNIRPDYVDTGYKVQKYWAGGSGYYKWHPDADSRDTCDRQLVVLWYLNDVEEGGRTGFKNLDIWVKPKKGRAVFFPPFWTHTHCGEETGPTEKYIATTWFNLHPNA